MSAKLRSATFLSTSSPQEQPFEVFAARREPGTQCHRDHQQEPATQTKLSPIAHDSFEKLRCAVRIEARREAQA
jgi:hypothetical protein